MKSIKKGKRLVFADKDLESYLNELGFERMPVLIRPKKTVPFHYVANELNGNPILHIYENKHTQGKPHERLFVTVIADNGVFELDYGRKDFNKAIQAIQSFTEEV